MLRFASVTVNLGPTFLSGALAANAGAVMDEPSCPLVQVSAGADRGSSILTFIFVCEADLLILMLYVSQ